MVVLLAAQPLTTAITSEWSWFFLVFTLASLMVSKHTGFRNIESLVSDGIGSLVSDGVPYGLILRDGSLRLNVSTLEQNVDYSYLESIRIPDLAQQ